MLCVSCTPRRAPCKASSHTCTLCMDTYTGAVESTVMAHRGVCTHERVWHHHVHMGAVCVHACEHAQICTNVEGVFRTGVSERTFGCRGAVWVSACAGAVWGHGCGQAL